ncbi:TBC1 domain family member 30 isoform X2 [Periophthalmus magnuspinnatus]|uniref:TBC1 domain family member 30 isoform X2 n=1 Tax=Periophthalmus magnuspinnatus TaxID=409849 RepID=UPI002436C8AE|nr:TBC1 domain family member 30 isoform X2 [Periophthalmus magnuspinnatus]
MASKGKLNETELLEVDICDDSGLCFEESGFVNSPCASWDVFADFQHWTGPTKFPSDTAAIQEQQQALPGPASGNARPATSGSDCEGPEISGASRASIVDCLLVELYDTYSGGSRRQDSWDSSTEASGSEAFMCRSNPASNLLQELQEKHTRRHQRNYLAQKDLEELRSMIQEVKYRTSLQSAKLIRQLKRRDRLCHKLQKNYDIITACLQAVSQKRRVDTRLKFTIEPSIGKNGFQQWYDALKSVARLPTGIPKEWRKRVWLTLADQYLHSISIDWEKTLRFAFNERSNPDDDSLGIQIVKDLHRTGCSSYCGQEGEQDRVVLKRVLLAYARWNKKVGYCQGFNVLAALILEVTEGSESDALKVMIYLIDKVLPESYFANNLQALSVDMAVFRDLLRLKLPRLSQHLHHLQKTANKEAGGSYEPPLTNVFTMQWFLTMFATCLPAPTVLKIWDSVFFEGSEVLFRVALAIWERLGERIEYCQTADDFYSTMGCLTQEMLEHNLIDPADLMHEVYSMAVFPFPQLAELREKYTYNITPFPTSVKSNGSVGLGNWESDDDADMDDEDSMVTALGCLGPLGGLLAPELQRYQKHLKDQRAEHGNIAELSPGAVGGTGHSRSEHQAAINSMMMERMSTDIYALKKQYARIKKRQQQQSMQLCIRTGRVPEMATSPGILQDHQRKKESDETDDKCPATRVTTSQLNNSTVINHLLLGRKPKASYSQGSPSRQRCSSFASTGSTRSSPWRDHVRMHRKNIARARAQLGFEDSEEKEDEEEEEVDGRGITKENELEERVVNETERDGSDCLSPNPSVTGSSYGDSVKVEDEVDVAEVEDIVVQLHTLDLKDESANKSDPHPETQEENLSQGINTDSDRTYPSSPPVSPPRSPSQASTPIDPPSCSSPVPLTTPVTALTSSLKSSSSISCLSSVATPASTSFYRTPCPSTPASLSASSSSKSDMSSSPSTPSFATVSTPKQPAFSPFPCVKQPRKSAAARNLGLYGPTAKTPTVHFPQMSRNFSRCGTAAATGRR